MREGKVAPRPIVHLSWAPSDILQGLAGLSSTVPPSEAGVGAAPSEGAVHSRGAVAHKTTKTARDMAREAGADSPGSLAAMELPDSSSSNGRRRQCPNRFFIAP